ncbi:hypothetical protein [Paracraurococcus lichenis]|uniref:Uncharacterized protein n=1 Tax=Paracraurococcus lichenis TaxID=3064888 RepID=A0ABT9E8D8_9PROT|nr:hypothetical protein [Paracraurococcus sp. LOR1-02]MDO9712462.1 hypothetical protein [Paracraurococcus sp. LOR1-02]
MRYAIIDSGRVVNVAEAEPDFAAARGWVASETAGPGWTFDGIGFAPPVEPTPKRVVSAAEFIALFTPAEVAAQFTADARLMVGAMTVLGQGSCNLDSPETAALLGLAVQLGVLATDRVPQILAGTPPSSAPST